MKNDFAVIDISGTRREVCLDLIDEEVQPGDYVICHAGFAIHKVDEDCGQGKTGPAQEIIDHEDILTNTGIPSSPAVC